MKKYKDLWKEFKTSARTGYINEQFHYITTVDSWNDQEYVKNKILHMLNTFGSFRARKEDIETLFNSNNMQIWKRCFTTHYKINTKKWLEKKIIESEANFELLELVGDTITNEIAMQYIRDRFPALFTSPKYNPRLLFRMDAYLHSDRMWRILAKELGLHDLLRYDVFSVDNMDTKIDIEEFIADIFEAFIGATYLICNTCKDSSISLNIGKLVCRNILVYFYNGQQIPKSLDEITDNISKFNDLHKSADLPFDMLYNYRSYNNMHEIIIQILEKNSVEKDIKECFMEDPYAFDNQPGWFKFESIESKEHLYEQVITFLKETYYVVWKVKE